MTLNEKWPLVACKVFKSLQQQEKVCTCVLIFFQYDRCLFLVTIILFDLVSFWLNLAIAAMSQGG